MLGIAVITLFMQRLSLEVILYFQKGLFVSKFSSGEFSGVWIKHTLETIGNKALKGQGGIIGLTTWARSSTIYVVLSEPITAKYSLVFINGLFNALPKDKSTTRKKYHISSKAAVKGETMM